MLGSEHCSYLRCTTPCPHRTRCHSPRHHHTGIGCWCISPRQDSGMVQRRDNWDPSQNSSFWPWASWTVHVDWEEHQSPGYKRGQLFWNCFFYSDLYAGVGRRKDQGNHDAQQTDDQHDGQDERVHCLHCVQTPVDGDTLLTLVRVECGEWHEPRVGSTMNTAATLRPQHPVEPPTKLFLLNYFYGSGCSSGDPTQ